MPLDIKIAKNPGIPAAAAVTVELAGSLDTATAPELERQLAPVLADQITELLFDLAELKFISSAGLRVFASTRKVLKERGGQAMFTNMQPQIKEVFAIMKSLAGIAVFRNTAELDDYLKARQDTYKQQD